MKSMSLHSFTFYIAHFPNITRALSEKVIGPYLLLAGLTPKVSYCENTMLRLTRGVSPDLDISRGQTSQPYFLGERHKPDGRTLGRIGSRSLTRYYYL